MKRYPAQKIVKRVHEIWDNDNIEVEVSLKKTGKVAITIAKGYSYLECKFSQLKLLSEFFETENIEFFHGYKSDGCPTCDSGSTYEIELEIW